MTYLSDVVSLHSTRYIVIGEWPIKVGGVQESLTEVEVRVCTVGWLGGVGGPVGGLEVWDVRILECQEILLAYYSNTISILI